MFSISFFKNNWRKKTLIKINLICFLAVTYTLIKKLCYKEMLSFSPILSQSRATQSLKNFLRRLCPLTLSLGGVPPSFVGARCARKCPPKFYFLICNTDFKLNDWLFNFDEEIQGAIVYRHLMRDKILNE